MEMNTINCLKRRTSGFFDAKFLFLLFTALFVLSGCASFGPRRVPSDRFNYNEALSTSAKQQMLLNIVRMRYLEEPVFLIVSSILTQYVYQGGAKANGLFDLNNGKGTLLGDRAEVGAGANLSYEERPTITYLPVEGREFTSHLLSTIPAEHYFAAAQEGWDVDILMQIGLQRFGAAENMSFGAIPIPEISDLQTQFQQDLKKLKRFQRVIQLLVNLSAAGAYEVKRVEVNGSNKHQLVFREPMPKEVLPMVTELKNLLGLSNGNTFLFTGRLTGTKENEITIQTRSVLAMMSFLSRGVGVPADHLAEGRVIDYHLEKNAQKQQTSLIPLTVLSSKQRPKRAFASVKYEDYWFYIENSDITSKRTLGLILALFRLQAPNMGGVAPVLTLSTG